MNTIISTSKSEPFPIGQTNIHNSYSGLLISNYKNVVNDSIKSTISPSVFNIKRRLKSVQFNTCCSIDTILKLSIFLVGILVAFN